MLLRFFSLVELEKSDVDGKSNKLSISMKLQVYDAAVMH